MSFSAFRVRNSMRLCAALLVSATCVVGAQGAILYQSALTAPPLAAGNLVGQDGWANHSGTGSFIQVDANGANVVQGSGSREDANVGVTPISAGQTYYFAFDVVVSGSNANVYFAHFKDAGTGTDFTTRVFVTPGTSGDFTFGLSPDTSSPTATWASDFSFGSKNRVVGSYAEGSNEVKLWVNPVNSSSTSLSATDPGANATAAFALRQSSGASTQIVSNLVVATSFDEALTGVPEPTALALSLLGAIAFVARKRG